MKKSMFIILFSLLLIKIDPFFAAGIAGAQKEETYESDIEEEEEEAVKTKTAKSKSKVASLPKDATDQQKTDAMLEDIEQMPQSLKDELTKFLGINK